MGAAGMDVSGANALVADEAADLDVLANDQDLVLQGSLDGVVAHLAGQQSVHVSGILLNHNSGHVLHEGLEQLVLGHEVGLGVDFQNNTHVALNSGVDHALGGDTASLLLSSGQALLTQVLDSLFEVAAGLGQRLLAVHHAAAGLLAQVLNVLSGKSHFDNPLSVCSLRSVCLRPRQPQQPRSPRRERPAGPDGLPEQRRPWRRRSASQHGWRRRCRG